MRRRSAWNSGCSCRCLPTHMLPISTPRVSSRRGAVCMFSCDGRKSRAEGGSTFTEDLPLMLHLSMHRSWGTASLDQLQTSLGGADQVAWHGSMHALCARGLQLCQSVRAQTHLCWRCNFVASCRGLRITCCRSWGTLPATAAPASLDEVEPSPCSSFWGQLGWSHIMHIRSAPQLGLP